LFDLTVSKIIEDHWDPGKHIADGSVKPRRPLCVCLK